MPQAAAMAPTSLARFWGAESAMAVGLQRKSTKQSTGREFIWDFDEEARRLQEVIPGLPIAAAQFDSIIATCRELEKQARADALVKLTVKA